MHNIYLILFMLFLLLFFTYNISLIDDILDSIFYINYNILKFIINTVNKYKLTVEYPTNKNKLINIIIIKIMKINLYFFLEKYFFLFFIKKFVDYFKF